MTTLKWTLVAWLLGSTLLGCGVGDVAEPEVPSEFAADIEHLGDGNLASYFQNADGTKTRRVLMGKRWMAQEAQGGALHFATQENQRMLFTALRTILGSRQDAQLVTGLPELEAAALLPVELLIDYNRRITSVLQSLGGSTWPSSLPVATLSPAPSCGAEEGVSRGGDGSQTCSRGSGSLWNRISFPLKPHQNCIKDQGNRGTCVAFAVIAAHETAISVQKDRWVNLSEQDFYRYGRWLENASDAYGEGLNGLPTLTYEQIYYPTLAFEKDWDYNPARSRLDRGSYYENSCVGYAGFPCTDSNHEAFCPVWLGHSCYGAFYDVTPKSTEFHPGSSGLLNTDDGSLATARVLLDGKIPLVLTTRVARDFDAAGANGIITMTAGGTAVRGGHGVAVIGYLNNSGLPSGIPAGAGGGYFIARNSWGCWGDGGYLYIPYDYVKTYGYNFFMPSVR